MLSEFRLRRRCRTSHEVRGLKYRPAGNCICAAWSHLTRGAWIEISAGSTLKSDKLVAPHTRFVASKSRALRNDLYTLRRTSHEVRGLKFYLLQLSTAPVRRRTSHEVRGLKFFTACGIFTVGWGRTSHEVRGLK